MSATEQDINAARGLIGVAGSAGDGAVEELLAERRQEAAMEEAEVERYREAPMAMEEAEIVDGEAVLEPPMAVVPYTGEALTLPDLTLDQLAEVLDSARQFEQQDMREFKRALQIEVLARMDGQATLTLHAEGWKLTGDSASRTDIDVDELRSVLDELVAAGALSLEAAEKAITEKTEYSVSKSGVNALKRLGGVVKDAIESCERPTARPRGVRVTPEVK